jgi:hypothetical protein
LSAPKMRIATPTTAAISMGENMRVSGLEKRVG